MTTDKRSEDDMALDAMFDAARAQTPPMSPDFMARLEADATAESRALLPTPASQTRVSILDRLMPYITVSGLTTATAAGIWIGLAAPETLNTLLLSDAMALSEFLPAYESASWSAIDE